MNLLKKWRCPHSNVKELHGKDIRITRFGGLTVYRLACHDCGSLLRGPLIIAKLREDEAYRIYKDLDERVQAAMWAEVERLMDEGETK